MNKCTPSQVVKFRFRGQSIVFKRSYKFPMGLKQDMDIMRRSVKSPVFTLGLRRLDLNKYSKFIIKCPVASSILHGARLDSYTLHIHFVRGAVVRFLLRLLL